MNLLLVHFIAVIEYIRYERCRPGGRSLQLRRPVQRPLPSPELVRGPAALGRRALYLVNNVLGVALDRVLPAENLILNYVVVAGKLPDNPDLNPRGRPLGRG